MKKAPTITNIIKGAIYRTGMTAKEAARAMGLPYQTMLYRFNNPGTWRFCEFGSLMRHVNFEENELAMIEHYMKGGKEVTAK